MKIIYLPHKGGLMESLDSARVFYDIKDMFQYIEKSHSSATGTSAFSIKDLSISYYGKDIRKGTEDYIICTNKYLEEDYLKKYGSPQAIGFCVFEKSLKLIKDNVRKYFESITK